MASKPVLVAQREFLENVRTKTFWIGILAFPVLFAISIGAGWVLNRLKETQSYAVLDKSGQQLVPAIEKAARSTDMAALARLLAGKQALQGPLARLQQDLGPDLQSLQAEGDGKEPPKVPDAVKEKLWNWYQQLPAAEAEALGKQQKAMQMAAKYRFQGLEALGLAALPPLEQEQRLNELVQKGTLFAFFVVGEKPQQSLSDFRYVSNNFTDADLRRWYADATTQVVQKLRIQDSGVAPAVARSLQERVEFREQKVTATGAAEDVKTGEKANKWAPVVFVYLLWIAVFTAAQMLLTNTVEEKSNRIIEVLLSSVSPLELMAGKIWGIAATGLTIVGSWVLCALFGIWLAPKLIAGLDLPLLEIVGDPLYLASFVLYFLFGYLLYAAILVGIGSVCNSLKEAQNLLQPVFILLFVPLVSMMFVVQEPNGTVAKVLSWVPLFTPFTMMNRAGGPPQLWEYAGTGVLLLLSVWLAFKAAGKVFRIGVLMTGNPPKLKEILGWLKEK